MLDALEMPSKHLLSNPMLAQALSITEGAAIVYSVRDEASFRLALGLAEFIREHFSPPAFATTPAAGGGGGGSSSPTSPTSPPSPAPPGTGVVGAGGGVGIGDKGRVYPIVLVGNKADDGDDDEAVGGLREEREVMYTEGVKAAAGLGGEWGGVPFVEVSAKTGEGVEGLFRVLGKEVLKGRAVMRERRERAERERLGSEMGSAKNAGGQGGKKRFALWRALFGRRKVAGR
jgi:GTPase SAR1 family protein